MDREKIMKMVVILAAIVVIATSLSKLFSRNSMSLSEYADINGGGTTATPAPTGTQEDSDDGSTPSPKPDEDDSPEESPERNESPEPTGKPEDVFVSSLTGAILNGDSQLEQRVTLGDGFYYEPISDNLRRYMTGISFPAEGARANGLAMDGSAEEGSSASQNPVMESSAPDDMASEDSPDAPASPEITFDELRYVHIWHIDFDGNPAEGELVCNEAIAADLAEIFLELYRNEYRLEKVLLIDEYEGDDTASMEDNNTSCFNYRTVDDTDRLSRHAYGLAIDINPLYNPYITYTEEGTEHVSPASALPYADRSLSFPYKIDEDDLCYKLFNQHGFTWGGNWNNMKDYQHFQKTLEPTAP